MQIQASVGHSIRVNLFCRQVYYLLFLILLSFSTALDSKSVLVADELDIASPFIRVYLPKEYRAAPYNWDLVQDRRGVLYIGNEGLVLEFDGSAWRRIMVGEEASVRALTVGSDGTVFVGAIGDLGYLAADHDGSTKFVSLRDRLPAEHDVFTDVWRAASTSRGVYFFLRDKIFQYDYNKITVIEGDFAPMFGSAVHDDLFVHVRDQGIARLTELGLEILPGTQAVVEDAGMIVLLPHKTADLLILTANNGFYRYRIRDLSARVDGTVSAAVEPGVHKIESPLADFMKRHTPYCATLLHDGRYAVGTSTGGIVIMDLDGRLVRQIDSSRGLPQSAVMGLYQDVHKRLWSAHFDSIASIDVHSPFNILTEREGLKNAPEAIARHQGRIYVGTSEGAFFFENDGRRPQVGEPVVRRVANLSSNVFALIEYGNELLVTSYDQIFVIKDDQATALHQVEGIILSACRSSRFPDYIFLGRVDGFSALRVVPPDGNRGPEAIRFIKDTSFESLNYHVRRIEEDGEGNLWLSTASHGLVRIRFTGATPSEHRFDRFGVQNGLPSDTANRLFRWKKRLLAATVNGFYDFVPGGDDGRNLSTGRFVPALELNRGFGDAPIRVVAVAAEGDQILWAGRSDGISRLFCHPDGSYAWDHDSWRAITGELNLVYSDLAGLVWIGTDDGLFSYNPRIGTGETVPLQVLVRRVVFGKNREIFPGVEGTLGASDDVMMTVSYSENAAIFEFSLPYFESRVPNQYRYVLDGFSREWSAWSEENKAVYTNLPAGEYRFRVEARNLWGQVSPPGWFQFRVSPPWHGTLPANLAKLLLLLSLFGLLLRLNARRLLAASKKLEQIVAERTAEVSRQKEEIRQQADALRTTNLELEKLSIVARETDNAVFIMDGEGTVLWVNEGFMRMYGERSDEFFGKRGSTIFEVSSNLEIKEAVRRCRDTGQTVQYEAFFKRTDGSVLWTQTTLTPILNQDGDIIYLIAIDSDITRIKTAEIELLQQARELEAANEEARRERKAAQEANTAKSEFLARMSHEIRTPMNGVLGFTEMLLDSPLNDDQRDHLQLIYRSGEALISLLNDILDFSKIEAGEMSLESIDFDPEVTVFDVCDLIMSRVNREMIEVICHIDERVPASVCGDAGRFRQVLLNLMGNAAKFTEAGEIVVYLKVVEENESRIKLQVTVSDTGIGIEADKLGTVFELFHQADGSTARRFGGTGLGLAICRQIATLLEGESWAESEQGRGSRFHFTAWFDKCRQTPGRDDQQDESSILEGKKVIVVDDNGNTLDILEYILTRAGMQVLKISDPQALVPVLLSEQARHEPVDLCVLDIQMPVMSGFELLNRIRQLAPPLGRIPVLAFSSSLRDRASRYREAGFNGYLPKPVRRKRLLSMLAHLLGTHDADPQGTKMATIVTQHTLVEKGKRSARILLVEDNPINQKLAMYIFKKGGYHLALADSGEEALAMLSASPDKVDLVFMDIQMPGMDGRETTRRIRSMGLINLPVIAMTAENMEGDREACLAAGMNDYIAKPVKRAAIYDVVRKWVLDQTVG